MDLSYGFPFFTLFIYKRGEKTKLTIRSLISLGFIQVVEKNSDLTID